MLGTKRCDRCYEMERAIQRDPVLAQRILDSLSTSKSQATKTGRFSGAVWNESGKPQEIRRVTG